MDGEDPLQVGNHEGTSAPDNSRGGMPLAPLDEHEIVGTSQHAQRPLKEER